MLRLIQFILNDRRAIAYIQDNIAHEISGVLTIQELALMAIKEKKTIQEVALSKTSINQYDYQELLDGNKLLSPIDHHDDAHCLITGTGLTHLGSASARDSMHKKSDNTDDLTDSMRIFQSGLEFGKPTAGNIGAQPEWFYKGDGSIVVAPNANLPLPDFSLDGGEEPEIVAIYIIGPDKQPYRIGYAQGNEFSDHITEKQNYLYLAHSKLNYCSFGPELLVGALPHHLIGMSRVIRDGEVIWEKEFLSGEGNMSHSLENLEYHHFKYRQFLRPGDIHVHFLGTATLSFSDNIKTQDGDIFEITIPEFGAPLKNKLEVVRTDFNIGSIKSL